MLESEMVLMNFRNTEPHLNPDVLTKEAGISHKHGMHLNVNIVSKVSFPLLRKTT